MTTKLFFISAAIVLPAMACASSPTADLTGELRIRRACMSTPVQEYPGYSKAKEDFLCVCVSERFVAGVKGAKDISRKDKARMINLAEAFYKKPPADGAVIDSRKDAYGVIGSVLDYIGKCEKTWLDQQQKN